MTTKSPANAAHDAARAEDERRAHAELHEYITSLERERSALRRALASLSDALGIRHADDDGATAIDVVRCMRTNYESACERAGWRELASVATLLGYERGTSPDFGEVDVVEVRNLVARRVHEAQEQGARWALDAYSKAAGIGEPEDVRANIAARICAEARANGGE